MALPEIRQRSLKLALRAGISIPPTLPLLDANLVVRGENVIANRLLCLTATAAVSYGFDRPKAIDWLRQESLLSDLTDPERHFLDRRNGDPRSFQTQIEGMWALAWALMLVSEFDFWKDCDSKFVAVLPNLKTGESGAELRRRSVLRGMDDLISALDLGYCLHWSVRQAQLVGKQPPAGLKPFVVVERRRALEWLFCDAGWDAVSLDT